MERSTAGRAIRLREKLPLLSPERLLGQNVHRLAEALAGMEFVPAGANLGTRLVTCTDDLVILRGRGKGEKPYSDCGRSWAS